MYKFFQFFYFLNNFRGKLLFFLIQNIAHQLLRISPIFQVIDEYYARKTGCLFLQIIHQAISIFLEIAEMMLCEHMSH